jgi:hypothetical protein
LFRTTIGTALSGLTVAVGDADDELGAGALEDALDDDGLTLVLGEADVVGVDDE